MKMSLEKMKILIIDDEKDLCFLLSRGLAGKGFEVDMKHLLQEGLATAESTKPDWIILDNNLPDGLGWEKVSWIRSHVPDARIIKVSADPESNHDTDNRNVFYVGKPLRLNAILEILQASQV